MALSPKTEVGKPSDWFYGLTERDRRFIEEYMVDLNGTQAILRMGVTTNYDSARSMAAEVRRKPGVKAALGKLFEQRGVSKLRIIEEYAKIAYANLGDYVTVEKDDKGRVRVVVTPTSMLNRDQRAAMAEVSEVKNDDGSVSIKIRNHDKLGALTYLGKACGLFIERQEISGPNGGAIEVADYEAKNRLRDLLKLKQKKGSDNEPDSPAESA